MERGMMRGELPKDSQGAQDGGWGGDPSSHLCFSTRGSRAAERESGSALPLPKQSQLGSQLVTGEN